MGSHHGFVLRCEVGVTPSKDLCAEFTLSDCEQRKMKEQRSEDSVDFIHFWRAEPRIKF